MLSIEFLLGGVVGAALMVFLGRARRWLARRNAMPLTGRDVIRQRAEAILEDLPVPFFIKAADGRYLTVNKAFASQLGVSARDLAGTSGERYWPKDEVARRLADDRAIFAAGAMACSELSGTSSSGQASQHFLSYKKPVFDERGNPLYLIGVCLDITERRRAETALRKSEARWKFALEGTGDGIAEWDLTTDTIVFSAGWKSLLGYEDGDIGASMEEWRSRIHPDDAMRAVQTLQRYLEIGNGAYVNEHRLRCKDGSYKWILGRGMVTDRDDRQRPLRMIGISTDITEARQTEAARLAHMARQRDVLVAEVHHRVKNSLQGVVGLLRQHKREDGNAGLAIDRAIVQVQTIALVYGLQGKSFASEVVLCEMVPGIARNLGAMLQPRPCFDIEVDVPKRIRVNEQEAVPVALIVNELIVNAVKHTQENANAADASILISVSWDRNAQQARILIRNSGGLAPEFDFASGRGIGTGLDLVRALLPPEGASLSFSSANDQVEVLLLLDMPSIYRLNV